MPPELSSLTTTSSLAVAWVKIAVTSSRILVTAEALTLPLNFKTKTRFLSPASKSVFFFLLLASFFSSLRRFFASAFCIDESIKAIDIALLISSY